MMKELSERNKKDAAILIALSETLRTLKTIPSGHLYAALLVKCPSMTALEFQLLIDTLKRVKLVTEKSHVLTWCGPELNDEKPR